MKALEAFSEEDTNKLSDLTHDFYTANDNLLSNEKHMSVWEKLRKIPSVKPSFVVQKIASHYGDEMLLVMLKKAAADKTTKQLR